MKDQWKGHSKRFKHTDKVHQIILDSVLQGIEFTAIFGPFLDLREFVDEENPNSLSCRAWIRIYNLRPIIITFPTFSSWLHYPSAGRIPPKFLHEDIIVSRKHESHRDEICANTKYTTQTSGKWNIVHLQVHRASDTVIW